MSRPLRVVRFLPELDFGGVESRVLLQSSLSDPSQIDLRVCALWKEGAAANALRSVRTEVTVLNVRPADRVTAVRALVRHLRAVRPDVLHCSIAEANVVGLVAGRLARVPRIIAEEVGMPAHGRRARAVFSVLYRTASVVVGVTDAVRRYLVEVDRSPPSRTVRIHNCAHPRFFPSVRPPVSRDREAARTLLVVGRLTEVKNQSILLDALAKLPDRRALRVRILGDGPLRESLEQRAAALGLAGVVSFDGFSSDVLPALGQAGAFVLPSLNEGCSISLIEAMATGVLPLVSAVPGNAEVLGAPLRADWSASPASVDAWVSLLMRYVGLSASARESVSRLAQDRAYAAFSPQRYMADLTRLYTADNPAEPR